MVVILSGSDFPKRALSHDNYTTDSWLKWDLFEGWFDPCPFNPDQAHTGVDGLAIDWEDRTFVNPPYSNPLPWVKKAIQQNSYFGHTIALLLKHDSSTEWYRLLHEFGAHFLLVGERLKHGTTKGAAFPSVLVIIERNVDPMRGQKRVDDYV